MVIDFDNDFRTKYVKKKKKKEKKKKKKSKKKNQKQKTEKQNALKIITRAHNLRGKRTLEKRTSALRQRRTAARIERPG